MLSGEECEKQMVRGETLSPDVGSAWSCLSLIQEGALEREQRHEFLHHPSGGTDAVPL